MSTFSWVEARHKLEIKKFEVEKQIGNYANFCVFSFRTSAWKAQNIDSLKDFEWKSLKLHSKILNKLFFIKLHIKDTLWYYTALIFTEAILFQSSFWCWLLLPRIKEFFDLKSESFPMFFMKPIAKLDISIHPQSIRYHL